MKKDADLQHDYGEATLPNASRRVHGHVGAYAKLVRDHTVNAQILFDRFHIVKHLVKR